MAATDWALRVGANSADAAEVLAARDRAIFIPEGIITALCGLLPEISNIQVNGGQGLKNADASFLTWLFVYGDGAVGLERNFFEYTLSIEAMQRVISGVIESGVDKTPRNIELFVISWREHLATLPASEKEIFLLRDTDLVQVEANAGNLSAALTAAGSITVQNLRGANGMFDDAAVLERGTSPRFYDDQRNVADSNANSFVIILYDQSEHQGGTSYTSDAAAGQMVDLLKATQ